MSAAALVAAVALPAAVAGLLLRRGLGPPRTPLDLAGLLAAAAVLGVAAPALLAYAWLLAGGALDGWYAAADAALFAAAALALAWRRPAPAAGAPAPPVAPTSGPVAWAALGLLGLAVVAAAVALVFSFGALPHGGWDAWAIWNHHARVLHRAGAGWRAAYLPSAALGQPDYPLALPLMVARLLAYAGEGVAAAQAVAATFTLAAPLVLAAAVARRAGAVAGAVAGLLLLATPDWLEVGSMQYADVPVGTLLLLGAAAAGEVLERPASRGAALAAGLALGLAGFTKNEGLAGAAAILLAWGALAWRRRGAGAALREVAVVAAGAALPALAWGAFRLTLAPELLPAFTSGPSAGASALARVLKPGRWAFILRSLPEGAPGAGLWLPLAAPALAVLLGLRPGRLAATPAAAAAAGFLGVVLLMFAATPHPLAWHLSTALARLLLQPWPLVLLALLGAARPAGGAPPPAAPAAAPAEGV